MGCSIGVAFFALGRSQLGTLFTDKQAVAEKKHRESLEHIGFTDDTAS